MVFLLFTLKYFDLAFFIGFLYILRCILFVSSFFYLIYYRFGCLRDVFWLGGAKHLFVWMSYYSDEVFLFSYSILSLFNVIIIFLRSIFISLPLNIAPYHLAIAIIVLETTKCILPKLLIFPHHSSLLKLSFFFYYAHVFGFVFNLLCYACLNNSFKCKKIPYISCNVQYFFDFIH